MTSWSCEEPTGMLFTDHFSNGLFAGHTMDLSWRPMFAAQSQVIGDKIWKKNRVEAQ